MTTHIGALYDGRAYQILERILLGYTANDQPVFEHRALPGGMRFQAHTEEGARDQIDMVVEQLTFLGYRARPEYPPVS